MSRKAEADLSALREKAAQLYARREEIDRAIADNEQRQAKITHYLEMESVYGSQAGPSQTTPPHQSPPAMNEQSSGSYLRPPSVRRPYGTMIAALQLCVEILRETGRPWHTRDLVLELDRRNLPLGGSDPVTNLSNRLGRSNLVRSHKLLGWHLVEWPDFSDPSKERIAILRAQIERNAEMERNASKPATLAEAKVRDFNGMSIPDAAISVISERGSQIGNVEIASVLRNAGFSFEGNLSKVIERSLRRRMESNGEVARAAAVVRVAPGTWGMASWYTEQEIADLVETVGGVPGRDSASHRERTLAGLNASRARGVRAGNRYRFSEEQMVKAKEMAAEGASDRDIGTAFGVSATAVTKWRAKWRAGVKTGH